MASPYKQFNQQLKTFFRECDKSFEDLLCFKVMLGAYKLLKSMNKTLPQKYWQQYVMIEHRKSIQERSDNSFFSPDFVPPPLYNNIVETLKNKWITLDNQTKSTIFDHMQVLAALSDRCVEFRVAKNKPPIETLSDEAIEHESDE